MAFRASGVVPAEAYDNIRKQAGFLKTTTTNFADEMEASGANFDQIRAVYTFLVGTKTKLATLASTPGLADYAAIQENDPAYNVAAEYTALIASIDATTVWVDNSAPATASVALPSTWISGPLLSTVFTSQQIAPLVTLLRALASQVV